MSAGGHRPALRALRAVVAAVAAPAAATAPATAAAGIGVQDFAYAPLGGSPTGSKPESKLWVNDGRWWASTLDSVRVRAGVATDATNPIYRRYVKFNVSGITGRNVTSFRLRLFCTDAGPDGGSVFAVDSGWVESALTWANAPALPAAPLAPAVAAALNAPAEISLPVSAVSTNGAPADGTYSFALAGAGTNSVIYGSRESANPPQLVVTTG